MTEYNKTTPQASGNGGIVPDTETLRIVATWREDLKTRYEREQLRYEICGDNGEAVSELAAEMRAFKTLCHRLKALKVVANA